MGTPVPPKEVYVLMHERDASFVFPSSGNVQLMGSPLAVYQHEEEALKQLLSKPTQKTWSNTQRFDHIRLHTGEKPLYAIFIGEKKDGANLVGSAFWIEKVVYSEIIPDKAMAGGLGEKVSWYISNEDTWKGNNA